jgi:hypothetical protein
MSNDEISELHESTRKELVRAHRRFLQRHHSLERRTCMRVIAERQKAIARPTMLLTPLAQRYAMTKAGKLHLTTLDRMLDIGEALALERWALCEELLRGEIKTARLGGWGSEMNMRSPVPDKWIRDVQQHMRFRKRLPCQGVRFRLLAAFVAIQNGVEGALSSAQYGLRFYPRATNKRMAFLDGIAMVALGLTAEGY